jgi:hypothetical protein
VGRLRCIRSCTGLVRTWAPERTLLARRIGRWRETRKRQWRIPENKIEIKIKVSNMLIFLFGRCYILLHIIPWRSFCLYRYVIVK